MIPAITFIGGGNMATAIISGLESSYEDCSIHICDRNESNRTRHTDAGRHSYQSISEAVTQSRIIVIAVKPQAFKNAMEEIYPYIKDHLIISVLAGITISQIENSLPTNTHVMRCMPNTPMAIGQGMVGLSAGTHATQEDITITSTICEASAKVLLLNEDRMNAITAVSGSGPAYFFQFCESMITAAESIGFTTEEAKLLVSQTASGSIAYLCSQDGFPASQLREQVTSKGGTTEAALNTFKNGDLTTLVCNALRAAEQRGIELSQQANA